MPTILYTKRMPVTKSISLELLPYGKTGETIKNKGYLKTDAVFRGEAETSFSFIDRWITGIVNDALSAIDTPMVGTMFARLGKILDSDDRSERSKKTDMENAIRKAIDASVEAALPDGFSVTKIQSESFISDILAEYYKSDVEGTAAIDAVRGKNGLLSKFLTSRITALNTDMPKRVLENFETYHRNISILKAAFAVPEVAKELNGIVDPAVFDDSNYPAFLIQSGERSIDNYNRMITGVNDGKKTVLKGFNMIVNEYNIGIRGKKDGARALRRLTKLDKQILMPTEAMFSIPSIENDDGVREMCGEVRKIEAELAHLISALNKANPEEVIVFGDNLHNLSNMVFGVHTYIPSAIIKAKGDELRAGYGEMDKKAEKKLEKELAAVNDSVTSSKTAYTMAEINAIMGCSVLDLYVASCVSLAVDVETAGTRCEKALRTDKPIRSQDSVKAAVKTYVGDAWGDMRNALSIMRSKDDSRANNELYDIYNAFQASLDKTVKANNMVRSYLTRSIAKTVETNEAMFGMASRRANKWFIGGKLDVRQNALIRLNGRYYFYVLSPGTKPSAVIGDDEDCRVMVYQKMQSPYQNLPKMTFTKAKAFFEGNPHRNRFVLEEKLSEPLVITREVYDLYASGACKKPDVKGMGEEEAKETLRTFRSALAQVLPVFIQFCNTYTVWEGRSFSFRDASEYTDLGDFYKDVQKEATLQTWVSGDVEKILSYVEEGKALMFEITNRGLRHMYETGDSSRLNEYAKPFLFMFSEGNRVHPTMKLNSRPGLFYRNASNETPVVHKAGSMLVNRRDVNGGFIPEDIYRQLFLYFNNKLKKDALSNEALGYIRDNLVKTRKAEYDIVKDARYHREMYKITISYEKNTECLDIAAPLNGEVNLVAGSVNRITLIRNQNDIIYMLVTDPKGKVLESRSLNVIDGIDYHKRLRDLERSNRSDRSKSWDYTGKIKDIRNGYFSKAISEIARAVVKYDAIIIMERISEHTRDKGFALGNTAYKTFETKLVARLSDLFFNNVKEGEPGSITNPYQLCLPADKCKSEFQNGIVYFVSGMGIATRDAKTGFNCDFDVSAINTKKNKVDWLSKFDTLRYDPRTGWLCVGFDYKKFKTYGRVKEQVWNMTLTSGITEYNAQRGVTEYIAQPFKDVIETMYAESGVLNEDISEVISGKTGQGNVSAGTVDLLYRRILKCLRGYVAAHENVPAMYVSPVTGDESDYSLNSALNLLQNYEERN